MAVHIRMTRVGRRNHAEWRIGVFDSRTRRDGRVLENLGSYDPHQEKKENKVKIDADRFHHWVSKGAKPSDAVARILKHTEALTAK
jgi:small subunit ribosomal protein S16